VILVGKPLAALIIVLIFGYPMRAALTVAVALAQIGEFSFILAEMGRALGMLPGEGYTLLIAASVLSISLNPFLFHAIAPLEAWLRRHPRLLQSFETGRAGELAKLPKNAESDALRGHALICGFGRAGSLVGEALRRRGFRFVAIEQDRRQVEQLRAQGVLAIYGDASNPLVLERANLATARTLVVALNDPAMARQIVELARKENPNIDMVVRCPSAAESEYLYQQGVREVVIDELELGLEMARHALRRFGVSATEATHLLQRLRFGRDSES
jgi:CPA2 family monovalent cation:H+ antiporter-2